jgi:hypothetical protein
MVGGEVVRPTTRDFRGYDISTLAFGTSSLEGAIMGELGFTPPMLADRVWRVLPVRYKSLPGGQGWQHDLDVDRRTLAHFNGERWHVVRQDPEAARKGAQGADIWQSPTNMLDDAERAAIARISKAAEFVLDATASLGGSVANYGEFQRALEQRAHDSYNVLQRRGIKAQVEPTAFMPRGLYLWPVLHQLRLLGPALYNALTGRAQRDSSDIDSLYPLLANQGPVADVTRPLDIGEATIIPPYERVDL